MDLTYSKCIACNVRSHVLERCPKLHFSPDKTFIIERHLYSKAILERQIFNRKIKKFFSYKNSVANLRVLSTASQKLRIDCDFYNEEEEVASEILEINDLIEIESEFLHKNIKDPTSELQINEDIKYEDLLKVTENEEEFGRKLKKIVTLKDVLESNEKKLKHKFITSYSNVSDQIGLEITGQKSQKDFKKIKGNINFSKEDFLYK